MTPDTHQGRAEWKNLILINMSNPNGLYVPLVHVIVKYEFENLTSLCPWIFNRHRTVLELLNKVRDFITLT